MSGTVIYRITPNIFLKYLRKVVRNSLLSYLFYQYGWSIFDQGQTDTWFIDDTMYMVVTDGTRIQIHPYDDPIDPDYILDDYSVEDVEQYIQDATVDICERVDITRLDLQDSILEDTIIQMFKNYYSFYEIVNMARDLDLID